MVYVGQQLSSKCHSLGPLGIGDLLDNEVMALFDTKQLHCPQHDDQYTKKITKSIITLLLNHWCCDVNRLIRGKRMFQKREKDPIKKLAYLWYTKHSKKKVIRGKFSMV